ncbi:MAG: hypothetical protein M3509_01825 [Chloroflexota bacterium]|nr:hypothetical protein [Chloroflexota bacterium]
MIERLLAASTSIQVDLPTYRAALRYRSRYGLSEQDAIIYSAAISHLSQNQSTGPHYFISRDNDFDDPGVAAELGRFDCSFVRSFNEGALRLDQRPGL